eukprot:g3108.t1
MDSTVNPQRYYETWSGHEIKYLNRVHARLRRQEGENEFDGDRPLIFFIGDSSLDNKYWFNSWGPAVNGYENVLSPPKMKRDVCYWFNHLLKREADSLGHGKGHHLADHDPDLLTSSPPPLQKYACLNTAVEATTLENRAHCLLDQDKFVGDQLQSNDIIVCSIGGNDIALTPTLCTMINIFILVNCTPSFCIDHAFAYPPNLDSLCDLGCFGCGITGCIAGCFSSHPSIGYFVNLFSNRIENYLRRILRRSKTKPRAILCCMIYYPDENHHTESWASKALSILSYNSNPSRLQRLIDRIFEMATSRISLDGIQVIPCQLSVPLDGKNSNDYIARVEPSVQGGKKMADYLLNVMRDKVFR